MSSLKCLGVGIFLGTALCLRLLHAVPLEGAPKGTRQERAEDGGPGQPQWPCVALAQWRTHMFLMSVAATEGIL